MRPKIIFGALFVTGALLAIILVASKNARLGSSSPNNQELPQAADSVRPVSTSARVEADTVTNLETAASLLSGTNTTNAAQAKLAYNRYVRKKINEFNMLGAKGDPYSVNMLLSQMKNPDKKLRHAALEALIQSNDRSIIPRLQELAAETEDPREKVEILDAIDFIKLPSMTEVLEKRRAEKAELGIINPPPHHSTNRSRVLLPPSSKKSAPATQNPVEP